MSKSRFYFNLTLFLFVLVAGTFTACFNKELSPSVPAFDDAYELEFNKQAQVYGDSSLVDFQLDANGLTYVADSDLEKVITVSYRTVMREDRVVTVVTSTTIPFPADKELVYCHFYTKRGITTFLCYQSIDSTGVYATGILNGKPVAVMTPDEPWAAYEKDEVLDDLFYGMPFAHKRVAP